MNQVSEFFSKLFSTSGFPARWHCGQWSDFLGWLYIGSDLLIWSAYFAIPLIIINFIAKKRHSIPFHPLFFLFAAFILACGTTHFFDAVMFWVPVYRFSALLHFITGIISWATVIYLIKIVPIAFTLKSPQELQQEIDLRSKVEEELIIRNNLLEEAQDIAKLSYWNWDINKDNIEWSEAARKIYGLPMGHQLNLKGFIKAVYYPDQEYVKKEIDNIILTGTFTDIYCRTVTPQKEIRHVFIKGEVIKDKNGNTISLKGMVQDITEQQLNLEQIKIQNEKLRDIAWIQSHKVRGPVSSILGLIQLVNHANPADPDNAHILQMLTKATNDLDNVIREVVSNTYVLQNKQSL